MDEQVAALCAVGRQRRGKAAVAQVGELQRDEGGRCCAQGKVAARLGRGGHVGQGGFGVGGRGVDNVLDGHAGQPVQMAIADGGDADAARRQIAAGERVGVARLRRAALKIGLRTHGPVGRHGVLARQAQHVVGPFAGGEGWRRRGQRGGRRGRRRS